MLSPNTMGIFDFARDAGSSIFGPGAEERAWAAAAQAHTSTAARRAYGAVLDELNAETGRRLTMAAVELRLVPSDAITVAFDAAEARATLMGSVDEQSTREKLVLLVGNHQGVGQVEDRLMCEHPAPAASFYTVVKGDTLAQIAKVHYGDALSYPTIFEANRPMLKDPDLIYPGQVLRLP